MIARFLFAAVTLLLSAVGLFAQTPSASPSASPVVAAAPASVQPKIFDNVLLDRFRQAGRTGLIQVGLSIFGAAFILERFARLRRAKIAPRGLMDRAKQLWREGKFAELERLSKEQPSTLARAISFIVKHRNHPVADISSTANDIVAREMDAHAQRAYPVGVVATLEPLLGLMGMVLGMIESFEKVALAGALGNPAQLAAGISEALTTTALGIGLAIPFLAFFHYFRNRTNNFLILLEGDVTEMTVDWLIDKEGPHGTPPPQA